ncbi:MAG: GGDEF domain-containing protein [Eubacteriaceae bacterium]|nr:GGDEF domain-containing protein [Eubacteriaceae bacterium]
MADIIFEYDPHKKIITIFNSESAAISLSARGNGKDFSIREIIRLIHREERGVPAAALHRLTEENAHVSCDCRLYGINGINEYLWYHISLNGIYDENNKLGGVFGMATDISESLAAGLEWKTKANTDSLTGISNRERAAEVIDRYLSETRGARGIFALVDMDDFKALNDTKGHIFGDSALRQIALLLKAAFRENDLISRLGGDEFAVFAFGASDYAPIAAKIISVGQTAEKMGFTTLSAGLAKGTRKERFALLYERADKALYEAKEAGKGICRVYRG